MPRDTETLVYDINKHRYYVTEDGVKAEYNKELKQKFNSDDSSNNEVTVFIRQVSDRVYRWLWWYSRRENKRILEKWIADDVNINGTPFREAMEEALYAQVEYMLTFSNDLKAIDTQDMNWLASPETKSILIQAGVAYSGTICVTVPSDEYRVGY